MLEYEVSPYYRGHIREKCPYCQLAMSTRARRPTRDHIFPRSRGGSNLDSNILIVCSMCNGDKGDMTIGEWLGWLQWFSDPRAKIVAVLVDAAIDEKADLARQIALDIEMGACRAENEFWQRREQFKKIGNVPTA